MREITKIRDPRPPTSFAPAMKKRYKTQYYSISRECP